MFSPLDFQIVQKLAVCLTKFTPQFVNGLDFKSSVSCGIAFAKFSFLVISSTGIGDLKNVKYLSLIYVCVGPCTLRNFNTGLYIPDR